ncbi:hypothetical protein ACROYT_G015556 [Oculina patagonica]
MLKKIDSLKKFDNQIIELFGSSEDEGVEVLIEKEIEDSDKVRSELNRIVLRMEEVLRKTDNPPPLNPPFQAETPPPLVAAAPQQQSVKARLPKLEDSRGGHKTPDVLNEHDEGSKSHQKFQGTRKLDCPAVIQIGWISIFSQPCYEVKQSQQATAKETIMTRS